MAKIKSIFIGALCLALCSAGMQSFKLTFYISPGVKGNSDHPITGDFFVHDDWKKNIQLMPGAVSGTVIESSFKLEDCPHELQLRSDHPVCFYKLEMSGPENTALIWEHPDGAAFNCEQGVLGADLAQEVYDTANLLCPGKEEFTYIGFPSAYCPEGDLQVIIKVPGEGDKQRPFVHGGDAYKSTYAFNECPVSFAVNHTGLDVSFWKLEVQGPMNSVIIYENFENKNECGLTDSYVHDTQDLQCPIYGCLDVEALNYDEHANKHVEDLCVDVIKGCMDPASFNYNILANTESGTCIPVVEGCTEPGNFNYDEAANTPVDCIPNIFGCTDPAFHNFNGEANVDDGSCNNDVYGCTDVGSTNFNPDANIDDGTCITSIPGCTNPTQLNFNANANVDDGSCGTYCNKAVKDMDQIIFCSECDYKGLIFIVTENVECLDWEPKSIHVPRGKSCKLHDTCGFKGQIATVTKDIACIEKLDFTKELISSGVLLSGKRSFLKNNKDKVPAKVYIDY